MKITCVSDTHGNHEQLDLSKYPADVLVHAGDFTGVNTKTAILNFLEWFSVQNHKHLILIAGNHEKLIEQEPKWFNHALSHFPSITYLNNKSVTIEGVKFFGAPYSLPFFDWAFMGDEVKLDTIWQQIPDDTQVLVTHGPAYYTHDLVEKAYGRDPHVGSKSLQNRKLELQGTLKAHISGHIHCAYGTSTSNGCINVGASVLNENYKLVNKPIILEI